MREHTERFGSGTLNQQSMFTQCHVALFDPIGNFRPV
jgi:hypothetical protein